MKKAALLLGGLIVSAFVSGTAAAEVVRVRLTARVTHVDDPSGYLHGNVVVGQRMTGVYVYNSNTPNQSSEPDVGEYRPYANEARVRFVSGSVVFESQQPTQGIEILITPNDYFHINSFDNKSLVNGGAAVDQIQIALEGNGNVNQTVALPAAAPNLAQYSTKQVTISTHYPPESGGGYTVRAEIEAAELVVPNQVVVSPGSGTFAANQHFDAAVILPRNSVVSNAHAMANGVLLPLTYPGSCQLQPQVGTGRPSLLCPGADAVLSLQPGEPIEWTVELTNGTIYTETVNWNLAP
jgi:hypothetical protein